MSFLVPELDSHIFDPSPTAFFLSLLEFRDRVAVYVLRTYVKWKEEIGELVSLL
jgi:hypothetical protein